MYYIDKTDPKYVPFSPNNEANLDMSNPLVQLFKRQEQLDIEPTFYGPQIKKNDNGPEPEKRNDLLDNVVCPVSVDFEIPVINNPEVPVIGPPKTPEITGPKIPVIDPPKTNSLFNGIMICPLSLKIPKTNILNGIIA